MTHHPLQIPILRPLWFFLLLFSSTHTTPLFLQSSVPNFHLVDVNNEPDQAHTEVFFPSRMSSPCDTYRINVGEGITISSSDKTKMGMHDRTFGIFCSRQTSSLISVKCFPTVQVRQAGWKEIILFQDGWREGIQGVGKGCDFHLQMPEADLWCRSGKTPLKSGAELWTSCIYLLSAVPSSDGNQELNCQICKEQAGGGSGSEPEFQPMPLPLWFSSSVISTAFSGSFWLLPHSQNNAGWSFKKLPLKLSARTCLNALHAK